MKTGLDEMMIGIAEAHKYEDMMYKVAQLVEDRDGDEELLAELQEEMSKGTENRDLEELFRNHELKKQKIIDRSKLIREELKIKRNKKEKRREANRKSRIAKRKNRR